MVSRREISPTHENKDELIDVEVDMFDWKEVKAPQVGGIVGLGPCAGIIIADRSKKLAFIGHFPEPHMGNADEMVETVVGRYRNKTMLKVFLGGLGPGPDKNDDTRDENRSALVDLLLRNGFENRQIYLRWLEGNESTVMSIDTNSGLVNYDTEKTDEL